MSDVSWGCRSHARRRCHRHALTLRLVYPRRLQRQDADGARYAHGNGASKKGARKHEFINTHDVRRDDGETTDQNERHGLRAQDNRRRKLAVVFVLGRVLHDDGRHRHHAQRGYDASRERETLWNE